MKKYLFFTFLILINVAGRSQVLSDSLKVSDSTNETLMLKSDSKITDTVKVVDQNNRIDNDNNATQIHDNEIKLRPFNTYKLKPKVDIPVTAITVGWSLYALTKIYNKHPSTPAEIDALRISDINSFDRPGATQYKESADRVGDAFFYSSMPLPLILLADKKVRREIGKVSFLFLESMGVTGFLYTGAVYFNDRHRPYTYNPDVDMEKRRRGGGKNSFFAGHVALVGTSTFFCASIYDHYHPHSPFKWVFYTAAAAATATTGYMRYLGGQHFKSDILLGALVGTASGLFISRLHNIKETNRLTFAPLAGEQNGFVIQYHFN